jgi:hypothetical protein
MTGRGAGQGRGQGPGREVLFEMSRVGAYVKVTAVDAQTGVEISIAGAASAPVEALKQQALNRLLFVLKRKAAGLAP